MSPRQPSPNNPSNIPLAEQYQTLLSALPLGIYETQRQEEQGLKRDVLVACNDKFAQLFGLNHASELIGEDIRSLFGGSQHYDYLLKELINPPKPGDPLLGHILSTRAFDGRAIMLEVNCRIHSEEDNQLSVFGIVRDVSDEARLREKISSFTADIGTILHTYSSHLVMVATIIKPTKTTLLRNIPNINDPSSREEMENLIDSLASQTSSRLNEMLDHINRRERTISTWITDHIKEHISILTNYKSLISIEPFRAPVLREIAADILNAVDNAPKGLLPRELVRALKATAWELERSCCLIALRRVEDSVSELDYQVRAFRDYITQGLRAHEHSAEKTMGELIKKSINNVTDFAEIRHIDIRLEGDTKALVRVIERDIVRGLSNLLHNAIKYSWHRTNGLSWITIRCRCEINHVRIEIENYGVAIPQDEIDSGIIFLQGIRGRLAGDRGRIGTGIGLADARRAAELNRGSLSIESRPASYDHPIDYSKPFITKAILILPREGNRK